MCPLLGTYVKKGKMSTLVAMELLSTSAGTAMASMTCAVLMSRLTMLGDRDAPTSRWGKDVGACPL